MLRVALVGCGRIAKRHAQLLGRGEIDGATLAGVCDTDETRAIALATEYGCPSYLDMDDMMQEIRPDVVAVLTPSGLHAEHVIRLSVHGKPIVVEKPMALTLADADAMIAACAASGSDLFVVMQNRFNVPVLKLREALEAGRFGRLVMGTVRVRWCRRQDYYNQDEWRGKWALDGGVFANQASHHVDLLQWMLGDAETVYAMGRTALVDIEVEDTAAAVLRFAGGVIGVVEATTATRPNDLEGSLSVLGEAGSVVISGFAVNELATWEFEDAKETDRSILERYSVNPPDVYGFGHKSYYEHVVDCLANGGRPLVDGKEGRRSLALITALYESIETHAEVRLDAAFTHSRLGRAGRPVQS